VSKGGRRISQRVELSDEKKGGGRGRFKQRSARGGREQKRLATVHKRFEGIRRGSPAPSEGGSVVDASTSNRKRLPETVLKEDKGAY